MVFGVLCARAVGNRFSYLFRFDYLWHGYRRRVCVCIYMRVLFSFAKHTTTSCSIIFCLSNIPTSNHVFLFDALTHSLAAVAAVVVAVVFAQIGCQRKIKSKNRFHHDDFASQSITNHCCTPKNLFVSPSTQCAKPPNSSKNGFFFFGCLLILL